MNFEFCDFTATPGEKYLGIAKIKFYGKIVLRYKIVPKKDGSGYFPVPASIKMPSDDGVDNYVSCFTVDSNSDKEDIEELIRKNIRKYLNPSVNEATSAYAQAPSVYATGQSALDANKATDDLNLPF